MPETRALFMGVKSQHVEKGSVRTGDGAVYVCAHGSGTSMHTVLDWRPFEQYTTHETLPFPNTTMASTYRLDPIEGGTRFTIRFGQPKGPWVGRKTSAQMMRVIFGPGIRKTMVALEERIKKDLDEGRLAFLPATLVPKEQLQSAVTESLSAAR